MRRTCLLLATAATLGAVALPAAAGPPAFTEVCHRDGEDGTPVLLTLPEHAAERHLGGHDHDTVPVDGVCEDGLPHGVLARATTVDPASGEPVLVGQLLDANDSGAPDVGDVVEMGLYPSDFAPTQLHPFGVTSHVVTGWVSAQPGRIMVEVEPDQVLDWTEPSHTSGTGEWFAEYRLFSSEAFHLLDASGEFGDEILARDDAVSEPTHTPGGRLDVVGAPDGVDDDWLTVRVAPDL